MKLRQMCSELKSSRALVTTQWILQGCSKPSKRKAAAAVLNGSAAIPIREIARNGLRRKRDWSGSRRRDATSLRNSHKSRQPCRVCRPPGQWPRSHRTIQTQTQVPAPAIPTMLELAATSHRLRIVIGCSRQTFSGYRPQTIGGSLATTDRSHSRRTEPSGTKRASRYSHMERLLELLMCRRATCAMRQISTFPAFYKATTIWPLTEDTSGRDWADMTRWRDVSRERRG